MALTAPIVRWKCPPSLWLRVGNRGARAYHRSAASRERCLSMTTRTTSEMVSVSLARGVEGGHEESLASLLPFKTPTAAHLASKVCWTTWTFGFKASILNMIAARAIAAAEAAAPQSDEVSSAEAAASWACLFLTYFPVISIASIIFAQAEFTTREWIYYRMLEHNVIIDFPSRNEHSYLSLWDSAAALWILVGTLLLIALIAYNAYSAGSAFPHTVVSNLAMQAYLMVSAVHQIRQMKKRLPDMNTLLLTNNREKTVAWIAQLEVMSEDTVQFHFLCVSEAAKAAASDRGSIPDVPIGAGAGLSNSIDFSKVGKEGFTEEKLNELRRASEQAATSGAVAALASWAMSRVTGSQWARLAKPTFYEAKEDREVVERIGGRTTCCLLVSIFGLALGVTSAGEVGQMLWEFAQGNTTSTMAS